jgi:DegV family protein with EDD domain
MSKVVVVTDSITGIPEEYLKKYPIKVAPAILIWSGVEYLDGVDIKPADFYKRLKDAKELPTTAAVSPGAFVQLFDELLAKGHDILGVFTGSKMSAIFDNAAQAREMVSTAFAQSGARISIIDSNSCLMVNGWSVIAAARAAAEGVSLENCKLIAHRALDQSGGIMMADTLKFMQMGGRISNAQRYLATAVRIRPLFEIIDAQIQLIERIRTKNKALRKVVDLVAERVANRRPVSLAVMHAGAVDTAHRLLEMATKRLDPVETVITSIGPSVGAHVGPGAAGITFLAGEVKIG